MSNFSQWLFDEVPYRNIHAFWHSNSFILHDNAHRYCHYSNILVCAMMAMIIWKWKLWNFENRKYNFRSHVKREGVPFYIITFIFAFVGLAVFELRADDDARDAVHNWWTSRLLCHCIYAVIIINIMHTMMMMMVFMQATYMFLFLTHTVAMAIEIVYCCCCWYHAHRYGYFAITYHIQVQYSIWVSLYDNNNNNR